MPTYDYRCLECRHKCEAVQRITEPPLERCPKCQGKVKRLIAGGVGVIFKGSGFYVNDSRSATNSAAPAGNGGKNGGSDKTSSSGDAKETTASKAKSSEKKTDS